MTGNLHRIFARVRFWRSKNRCQNFIHNPAILFDDLAEVNRMGICLREIFPFEAALNLRECSFTGNPITAIPPSPTGVAMAAMGDCWLISVKKF
jgi:hypothetical protein